MDAREIASRAALLAGVFGLAACWDRDPAAIGELCGMNARDYHSKTNCYEQCLNQFVSDAQKIACGKAAQTAMFKVAAADIVAGAVSATEPAAHLQEPPHE